MIQEKQYLHAVRILRAAEKSLYHPDIEEVGALHVMREKMLKTKTYLQETLLAELQNHLYLKTRAAMKRLGQPIPDVKQVKIDIDAGSPTSDMLRFRGPQVDETPTASDMDSFHQIQALTEGLFHLGQLQESIQVFIVNKYLKERISIELYHVVDRVIEEVEAIYPQNVDDRGVGEVEEGPPEHVVLHEFLIRLYQQFQAVLNGHIFLVDFIRILNDHADERFDCYTKREVACAIQNEVKALLYDYLTGNEAANPNTAPVIAVTEMLKDTKKVKVRTSKQVFHLRNLPDDELKKKFEEACPVDGPNTKKTQKEINQENLIAGMSDKFTNVIESGHKLLVTPSSSNILVSFKPTIEFMRTLEKSIRMRLANFKVFLDDFIFNVYLPQIQEQVLVYYHANVNGIDAFQADMNPDANFPLIKSALCLILAMHGICRTLKCMPVHSDELVRFLESVLRKYYERCRSRFRGLLISDSVVSEGDENDGNTVLSVEWAVDHDLAEILRQNTYLDSRTVNLEKNRSLYHKETFLELSKKGERSFHRLELLLETRKVQHMGHLLYGIQWLLDQFEFLRGKAQQADVSQSYISKHSKEIMRAFSNLSEDSGLNIKLDSESYIDLPLSAELEEY